MKSDFLKDKSYYILMSGEQKEEKDEKNQSLGGVVQAIGSFVAGKIPIVGSIQKHVKYSNSLIDHAFELTSQRMQKEYHSNMEESDPTYTAGSSDYTSKELQERKEHIVGITKDTLKIGAVVAKDIPAIKPFGEAAYALAVVDDRSVGMNNDFAELAKQADIKNHNISGDGQHISDGETGKMSSQSAPQVAVSVSSGRNGAAAITP